MLDTTMDLDNAVFAKTEIGQREIKTRELRLLPMVRRLLILIDGQRSGKELAPMLMGQSLDQLMAELIDKECVSLVARTDAPAAPSTALATGSSPVPPEAAAALAALASLPPADSRSDKNREMARNFMTNTLNAEFGMNMRLSLIEAIANCSTSEALRQIYPTWHSTMNSSKGGAKELPKLIEKLFHVL
jgi:hypothetical protein